MRGFTTVSVNYDGVHQPSTMVNRNYDSFAFDSIEVLKGPASVMFGEGALGGAVNFVPKKPYLESKGFQGLAQYGSLETYRVAGDVILPLGDNVAARAVVSLAGTDGYIDGTDSHSTTANLAINFKPSDRFSLLLSGEIFNDNHGRTYWGTPFVPPTVARRPTGVAVTGNGSVIDETLSRTNFQYSDALVRSKSHWLRAQAELKLNDQWKLSNDLSYNKGDRLWRDAESYAYAPATKLVNRQPFIINNLLEFWNDRLTLNSDTRFGGHRSRFALGVEHGENEHLSIRRFGALTPADPYNLVNGVFPVVNAANFPGAGNFADVFADITVNAVFAEEALNLTDKWLVVGGARYEDIKLDRTTHDFNLNTDVGFIKHYKPFSFRIGTVYDLLPKTQIYAQYSSAAAPIGTLVLLAPANGAFTLSKGRTAEVGVKSSFWRDRISTTLSGYWIRQTDIITRDPNNSNISIQGGTLSSRGIEASISATLTRQLHLDANYAVVNARFDQLIEAGGLNRKGNSPTNVPAQVLNVYASYQVPMLPIKLTGGMRDSAHIFGDNANSVRIKGYTVFDASISYRMKVGDLTLRGRNLGDKLYAEWGGANSVYLAAPRTVDLTFRTRF
ncbi:MAG: TonB-dependent receptor, partial [Lysobacter sp.]|nr:TonB-dependent receptor [Lysobacter sp.]